MSHSTATLTTTRTSITAPDTASVCSLASTLSVNWEDEKKGNADPPAATTLASTEAEKGEEAGAKTGSLIIRNLFIIGFLIPLAWIVAVIKVFILNRRRSSSPLTTSDARQTDIEANALPKEEEKYCEGLYWACLCLVAGVVYIAGGLAIVWIFYVEKQRWKA
ncbi:hypothetical protein B9Z19DRAFT_1145583 [Tuber borchii]|uniref:Uncharacterized protein n=1 Tax=Tuber borchii TaxID=42251 RepID=A0A2T7A6D3_TUBBO|nr:hypothetical protein B9Z19DRAFT_1145583 [Tuber borchii]